MAGWLNARIPILGWLRDYRREWFGPDLLAGLTTGSVVIPKAMAFAAIAGLPVETGLYTAFVPMAIYAVLGTSRRLSVSTTTIIAILTATELGVVVPSGSPGELLSASISLAFLVGVALIAASFLRLGFIANFISDPVLTGFKAGTGLVILVDQIPKLLGLHAPQGSFVSRLGFIAGHLPESSLIALAVGLATLAVVFLLEYRMPHLPAPLIAVVIGVGASALLGLETMGVATVGPVAAGLPSPALPEFALVGQLWPAALGIALMSFVESIAVGRSFVGHGEPRPRADQELLALGLANIAGALFRAMPAGGGASQTAVNQAAGARSQVSSLVSAALAVTVMLFLAPLIRLIPQATLAAVVIATSLSLINLTELRAIQRVRGWEFSWALIAIGGVLLLGTLNGILVAVCASLVSLIYQSNHPPVYALSPAPGNNGPPLRLPENSLVESSDGGLLILRTEGRVYFANAQHIGDRIWPMIHAAKPKVVILECSAIPDIEYTALKMLYEADGDLAAQGIALWLAAENTRMARVIDHSPLGTKLGTQRRFADLSAAVAAYRKAHGIETAD